MTEPIAPSPRRAAITHEPQPTPARTGRGPEVTRRRVLQGGLGLGVATVATQLIGSQVAFAAPDADGSGSGALVVVFLRGGMDGLSLLVPAENPAYLAARPEVAVRGRQLITLERGFGLHPAMAPLKPWVSSGRLAFVPAVATPNITRSHFQAQACLESGGGATGDGWLDRLLTVIGAQRTLRALAAGGQVPTSLDHSLPLTMADLPSFQIQGYDGLRDSTRSALARLYSGLDSEMARAALTALEVEARLSVLATSEPSVNSRGYSDTDWGRALGAIGSMIRADVGLRVATVDLGGWDMHTAMGTADQGAFQARTTELAGGLATFLADLGAHAADTTVVVMSEFGRRFQQNASGGTDHGHGGVTMVLGAGVSGGVKGRWSGLESSLTADGDVAGANDHRDVLSEVVMARFGLSSAQAKLVFPGWNPSPLGVMA